MPIKIRPAELPDIAVIADLVEAYWPFENISGFDRASVEHNLRLLLSASHLGAAWIALEADSPCGYLLAAFVFSLEHGGLMAEIDELFVLPTHRGSGTGSALLQAAEALFMQTGCKQAQLQLARSNEAARRFYQREGYTSRSNYELLDKPVARSGFGMQP